jgi:hypothetical protein
VPVAVLVFPRRAATAGYATEIRKRAERRFGELMEVARKAGKLAKPPLVKGPGRGKKGKTSGFQKTRGLSLKKQGIDKNLADRARKVAALPRGTGGEAGRKEEEASPASASIGPPGCSRSVSASTGLRQRIRSAADCLAIHARRYSALAAKLGNDGLDTRCPWGGWRGGTGSSGGCVGYGRRRVSFCPWGQAPSD